MQSFTDLALILPEIIRTHKEIIMQSFTELALMVPEIIKTPLRRPTSFLKG